MSHTGTQTLELLQEQDQFNQWMFEQIAPYCQGKILEIGSGLGNISQFCLAAGHHLTLSDVESAYCDYLKTKYHHHPQVDEICSIKLGSPQDLDLYQAYIQRFDTVFALNVIEHIANDYQALDSIFAFLKPGGRAIILVPAYQALYNQFDENLLHFRRYNCHQIARVMKASGFNIEKRFYFNAMGIVGWYVSSKLMGNREIPQNQMKLFSLMMPINRLLDRCVRNKLGLSAIVIGRKALET